MSCGCGKPKCDGHCGISPAVLQINNPSECVIFHRVEVPASLGDSETNPPKNGEYRNVLLYYEADQTSWLYSSDGIPTRITGDSGGGVTVDSALSATSTNPVQNRVISSALNAKANSSDIPTTTSQLTNDSGYQTAAEIQSAISAATAGKQDTLTAGSNISISGNTISATDTTYAAGNGLDLTGTVFSVDTDVVATQNDLANVTSYITDATEYSASATYAVGDYAIHNGAIYQCNIAIVGGEAWDASHWDAVPSLQEQLDNTETWTFELEGGTTVTKKVVVR